MQRHEDKVQQNCSFYNRDETKRCTWSYLCYVMFYHANKVPSRPAWEAQADVQHGQQALATHYRITAQSQQMVYRVKCQPVGYHCISSQTLFLFCLKKGKKMCQKILLLNQITLIQEM